MKRILYVFNKLHYPVTIDEFTFPPGEETEIFIETSSWAFRVIRSVKGLKFGNSSNEEWKRKYAVDARYDFNMVYDISSQRRGGSYVHVVEALSNPIMKHLPEGTVGFTVKPGVGINLRFFSESRITQLGKFPVGPLDVFMSHGIGDKNYWVAARIAPYPHALVPGPAWKERIEAGGYQGKVWVVGYTKLDPIFNGEYIRQERTKPYVVWAPTHGYHYRYKGRSSYPQCLELVKEIPEEYETHVALHPASRLQRKQIHNVTLQELLDADVVIADAGSTLYEAWALGKPVIFPDWICRDDVLANFDDDHGNLEYQIYDQGIGYHAKDMDHLNSLIDVALRDGMGQREIDFMERIFPKELRGKAGQMAAKALLSIAEGE